MLDNVDVMRPVLVCIIGVRSWVRDGRGQQGQICVKIWRGGYRKYSKKYINAETTRIELITGATTFTTGDSWRDHQVKREDRKTPE